MNNLNNHQGDSDEPDLDDYDTFKQNLMMD